MKISKRANKILPSLTRKLFNMAKDYDDVIDLTLGDPDLAPPKEICDSAYEAMKDNRMHYSANAGLSEARCAAAENIKEVWGADADPDENIIVTVGGMEALYLCMLSVVDEGDEVIVFAPYYVNYIQMIELCGGTPVIVNAYDAKKGLFIDEEALASAISDKTAAIIVNSPNNPTGDMFCRADLEKVAKAAKANDLLIVSDEVYRTLIYDDLPHESILNAKDAQGRTLLVDSMSKEYSMTGFRVGYAFGESELISNMIKLQENVAACACVSSQYALAAAYRGKIPNGYIRTEFQKRRDFLFKELEKLEKLTPMCPKGTFYMFVNIEKTGMKSEEFAYRLLECAHIAVVPGVAYGADYDGYIRIAFTKDVETLKEATIRLKSFLDKI